MRNKFGLRVFAISVALVVIASSAIILYRLTNKSKIDEGNGLISLEAPFFISTAEASPGDAPEAFPADEAGISAYVNVGQSIDLEKAKKALVGTRAEGDDYIIGIIELEGLPEDEFPHMYFNENGWILAYYTKIAPASRIMQWHGYNGGPITTTTLQDAIAKSCPEIRVDFSSVRDNISYYHFQYPEATEMVMSVDIAIGSSSENFNYLIPFDVTLFEGSWSQRGFSWGYSNKYSSSFSVDGGNVSRAAMGTIKNGKCRDSHLTPGDIHNVNMEGGRVAILFIYQ